LPLVVVDQANDIDIDPDLVVIPPEVPHPYGRYAGGPLVRTWSNSADSRPICVGIFDRP
jgi:hypothetical protein